MTLAMRWTKRFLKRLALSEPQAPNPEERPAERPAPAIRLESLAHHALNAAARWCAARIECAPAAHARATRPATSEGAFYSRSVRHAETREGAQ